MSRDWAPTIQVWLNRECSSWIWSLQKIGCTRWTSALICLYTEEYARNRYWGLGGKTTIWVWRVDKTIKLLTNLLQLVTYHMAGIYNGGCLLVFTCSSSKHTHTAAAADTPTFLPISLISLILSILEHTSLISSGQNLYFFAWWLSLVTRANSSMQMATWKCRGTEVPRSSPHPKVRCIKSPDSQLLQLPRLWELPSKTEFSYTQWKFLIASYIWVTFFSCFAFSLPIVVSWNYLQNKLFEVKSLFQGLLWREKLNNDTYIHKPK